MPSTSTCRVKQCRFSKTHTTKAHQCGTCGLFGHGQLECHSEAQKADLARYNSDILPSNMWCNLCPTESEYKKTHTTSAHICPNCNERANHPLENCIIQEYDVFKQRFQGIFDLETFEPELFQNYADNIYTILYAGMGCSIFVRNKGNQVKALFMHQDAWGQYGPSSDDTPTLNKFKENCQEVAKDLFQPTAHPLSPSPLSDDERIIACPICRTENPSSSIKMVYGTEEKCKICFEENITKFFSECGHLVSCDKCFESL